MTFDQLWATLPHRRQLLKGIDSMHFKKHSRSRIAEERRRSKSLTKVPHSYSQTGAEGDRARMHNFFVDSVLVRAVPVFRPFLSYTSGCLPARLKNRLKKCMRFQVVCASGFLLVERTVHGRRQRGDLCPSSLANRNISLRELIWCFNFTKIASSS